MAALKAIVFIVAVILTVIGPARADRHLPTLPITEVADDGMYAQKWLYKSSLNLQLDLAATRKEGKRLVIFWEQKVCSNCQPMYEINLRIPRVIEKIKNNFNVIKLDIFGDRKITDLNGMVMSEEELAGKNGIQWMPTLQFLPESLAEAASKTGKESEVFRLEGYLKPFHFYFIFHYVTSKGYESQPSFQRWLSAVGKVFQAKNIPYDLWADALPPKMPNGY